MGAIQQGVRRARALRPARVRQDASRPFRLHLIAADAEDFEALSRVFVPAQLPSAERNRALAHLAERGDFSAAVQVRSPRVPGPAVAVDWRQPTPGLRALLLAHPGYRLALARVFPPLRQLLAHQLIHAFATRNAAVAAISALPEVFPTPLSLVLALGEIGPDTALLTANQISLCFQLAALHDQDVGWRAQAGAIAGIVAGAFGWRTLAREVVGLIPAGIGLAAKTAIAYSGTVAVGEALLRKGRCSTTVNAEWIMPPSRRLASRRETA